MLKQFYQNETDIPENLKGAYVAVNGRYELDKLADDHPTVQTNKSLNLTQSQLKTDLSEIQQKLTIAETKVLADGMVAVAPEIKEIGEAANHAGLKKKDIAELQTKTADLQKQLDAVSSERVIDEVATAKNFNSRFKKMAADKNLKFEKVTEKVDGKDVDDYLVVLESGKPKVDDFLKTDSFFSEFADTFRAVGEKETGVYFPQQRSAREEKQSVNPADKQMAKYSPPASAAITQN